MDPIFATKTSGHHKQFKVSLAAHDQVPNEGFVFVNTPNGSVVRQQRIPHVGISLPVPKFGEDSERTEGFRIIILPAAFADVAREMLKADPQEAIRDLAKLCKMSKFQHQPGSAADVLIMREAR
jgi:hypothetical protein